MTVAETANATPWAGIVTKTVPCAKEGTAMMTIGEDCSIQDNLPFT